MIDDAGAVGARFAPIAADDDTWHLATLVFGHDPSPLVAIDVPLLAVFGAAASVVPVGVSVDALGRFVRPELLHVAVMADGDHRVSSDGRLVDGCAEALLDFLDRVV